VGEAQRTRVSAVPGPRWPLATHPDYARFDPAEGGARATVTLPAALDPRGNEQKFLLLFSKRSAFFCSFLKKSTKKLLLV
jgi:hypothetical protein